MRETILNTSSFLLWWHKCKLITSLQYQNGNGKVLQLVLLDLSTSFVIVLPHFQKYVTFRPQLCIPCFCFRLFFFLLSETWARPVVPSETETRRIWWFLHNVYDKGEKSSRMVISNHIFSGEYHTARSVTL